MKRGKRRIQKVWILLNTTELKQTKQSHQFTNKFETNKVNERESIQK